MKSSESPHIKLVGILNVTPDSFSDGGNYLDFDAACLHAKRLIQEGAAIIDVGADSTRPGSECVGIEEEWSRIRNIIPVLAKQTQVSVDTHHSEIARRAIASGAMYINDVFCGFDADMFPVVANSEAKLILTFTRCITPHIFSELVYKDIISDISEFLKTKIEKALQLGVRREQIILDPGMGAFLSNDPQVSWDVLRNFEKLTEMDYPLMIGISRKGFLKQPGERSISDRDCLSAHLATVLAAKGKFKSLQYIRVHNVELQRSFLEAAQMISM